MGTLKQGAYNAIHNCIKLKPNEVVTIITDESTLPVSKYLIEEANRVSRGNVCTFVMEAYGQRDPDGKSPMHFPAEFGDQMKKSHVSIYAAHGYEGELKTFRMPMTKKHVDPNPNIRHVHMANLNYALMTQGMCVDYEKVKRFSAKVKAAVENAKVMRVTSLAGTDFTAEFDPKIKWYAWDGNINPKNWMNLPEGEVLTCVKTINGIAVIDGVLGDSRDEKYGLLDDNPVRLDLENGRVAKVRCHKRPEIQLDIEKYLTAYENATRIGELAIGTLIGIEELIGILAQDEKKPGTVHIAIGDGLSQITKVDWKSEVHLDGVMRDMTMEVDDRLIMKNGKFMI